VSAQLASIPTPRGVIAVRHDGPPEAPTLQLCQRFRGAIEDWDPGFISALAHQRRMIRLGLFGFGARGGQTTARFPTCTLGSASTTGLPDTPRARRSMSGVGCRHIALSVALSLAKTN
jgi:hypothetical protein